MPIVIHSFFLQAEDGIRERCVTGVQTCALPIFVLSVVLMSLATVAFAQSDGHKMAEPKAPAPKSEGQTSFDAMKTLAGDWEGPGKTDMPVEIGRASCRERV